jgi:hypothetical protein
VRRYVRELGSHTPFAANNDEEDEEEEEEEEGEREHEEDERRKKSRFGRLDWWNCLTRTRDPYRRMPVGSTSKMNSNTGANGSVSPRGGFRLPSRRWETWRARSRRN